MAPLRELPEHSVATPGIAVQDHAQRGLGDGVGAQSGTPNLKSKDISLPDKAATTTSSGGQLFKEPDFGTDGASDKDLDDVPPREEVLSPTQTRA